jgi:PAS domain S-box-containing protein
VYGVGGTEGASGDERQLAMLVNQATGYAIFTMDTTGVVQSWNSGAARLTGYTREEIVGRHFSVFYTEEGKAQDHPAEVLRMAAQDGRYEEEGWRVRKDGSRFWASIAMTAIHDENGELIGFGKVSRDLTARRLSEEQTRAKAAELEVANRQLEEFRRLVSSVRDYAIFMLDPGGHILSWNAGARRLKGYEPAEIIGRHFSTFYTAPDRARNHPAYELEVAIREGRYEEEGWRVRKDGSTFWASVTITAIRDDDGRLTGFAKVTRDLTERKRSEEALQEAVESLRRANAELDRFASIAAHDMTDPLRTISGFAEVLVETDPGAEVAREYAQHILDSSLRLSGMLRGLLAYSRAGGAAAVGQAVDLALAVGQAKDDLDAVINERDATVAVDLPPGASVVSDPHDLRVILQNLLANAIRFGAAERPLVTVGAAPENGSWRVVVHDDGRGIPLEHQARIFEAFERVPAARATVGYGLGLAICKRLVERHGGRIGVESRPGAGTSFWFTVPTAVAGAPERDEPVDAAVPLRRQS